MEATPMFSMFALLLLVLLVLGGLTVTVLLMISRKTRPYGMALLGVGVVGLIAVLGISTSLWSYRSIRQQEAVATVRVVEAEMHRRMLEHGDDPKMPPMPEVIIDEEAHAPAPEVVGTVETTATTADSEPEEPYEETAEPTDTTKRPEWVDARPGYTNGVYRTVVVTNPLPPGRESQDELRRKIDSAIRQFVTQQLAIDRRYAEQVRLSENYIQTQIVRQQWAEKGGSSSYPDYVELHAQLEFDSEVQDYLRSEYRKIGQEQLVAERLMFAGTGLLALLALLSIVFGTLKIDRATEGKKRGRLGLAAVVASVAVVTVACSVGDNIGRGNVQLLQPLTEVVAAPNAARQGPDYVLIDASESPQPVLPDVSVRIEDGRAIVESSGGRVEAWVDDDGVHAGHVDAHASHVNVHASHVESNRMRASLDVKAWLILFPIASIVIVGFVVLLINRKIHLAALIALVVASGILLLACVS